MKTLNQLGKAYETASNNIIKFYHKMESAKSQTAKENNEYKYEAWTNTIGDIASDIEEGGFSADEIKEASAKYRTLLELI